MSKTDIWEIIGDCLIVICGVILLYVFITIEVLGYYGVEQNEFIRHIELYMGIPIIAVGISRLLLDLKK